MEIGQRHGIDLLNEWQKLAIQAEWVWRQSAPPAQAANGGQLPLWESDQLTYTLSLKGASDD